MLIFLPFMLQISFYLYLFHYKPGPKNILLLNDFFFKTLTFQFHYINLYLPFNKLVVNQNKVLKAPFYLTIILYLNIFFNLEKWVQIKLG